MPWRESSVMEERLRFVARRLEGESMTALCREFGISRKTGHKVLARYKEHGLEALGDRPRTPARNANRLAMPVEARIVALKREKPHWGARKLRELLARRLGADMPVPARSTIHAVLDRHGLVEHARERRPRATGTALSQAAAPNDIWCTDFKGEFRLGNRRWCYPLTVTDQAARYLLLCEALEGTREDPVITAFHRLFEERGLPAAIRSDVEPQVRLRRNGVPFASTGLYGLSRLAVWWLRLGIRLERITPGKPQQNGRHERMHLTLKQETTRPAAENSLQQQARFDAFLAEFNAERPHEALAMKTPAELYTASSRRFAGLPELEYPLHDRDIVASSSGAICLHGKRVAISTVLAGQRLGLREVEADVWLVSFMHYDLGYIDLEARTLQRIANPFGTPPSPSS
jgi:transposase InsO family protein